MKDKRCVHLDFHTSDEIENVGADFSREDFISAIKAAGLDSISVFAKCHHGCFYYKSEKFYTHPHLAFPLLDEQVAACKEAGVSAKIYISAGFDEHTAFEHPEWLNVNANGDHINMLKPGFKRLCFNTPYLDLLVEQTKEVMHRYMPDGVFFDIVGVTPCTCGYCMADMKKKGLDYKNPSDLMKQADDVFVKYATAIEKAVHEIKPDTLIFHNAGDFPTGKEIPEKYCDQLEAESLPTGGWGYDHFPMTMSYIRRKGKNCIGMTGKFHQSWGEFGGFKYKEALLYEGAQCLAFDAGFNVGDQLHPRGRTDKYTYESIGCAMNYLKERDTWRGGEYIPELAVFSENPTGGKNGICRMLFESKYLFDLIGIDEISNKYPLIILGDSLNLSEKAVSKLKKYAENGGKILAFGAGGIINGDIPFDLGAKIRCEDDYNLTYIKANYPMHYASNEAMAVYSATQYYHSYYVEATGEVLAQRIDPYFHREGLHFCSHNNIPADFSKVSPAITEGKDGIYVCASLTNDYYDVGSMNDKQLTLPLIERLLRGKKTIKTNFPSTGKMTLYKKEGLYLLHLVFASIVKRGKVAEVIEDLPTLADISVTLDLPVKTMSATLRPSGKKIELTRNDDGTVSFTLDKFRLSEIVELR